jgi:hypothetical protein
MIVIIEKKYSEKKVNQMISEMTPKKVFNPDKFAGKVKWDEEPLEYQKRVRNEWR